MRMWRITSGNVAATCKRGCTQLSKKLCCSNKNDLAFVSFIIRVLYIRPALMNGQNCNSFSRDFSLSSPPPPHLPLFSLSQMSKRIRDWFNTWINHGLIKPIHRFSKRTDNWLNKWNDWARISIYPCHHHHHLLLLLLLLFLFFFFASLLPFIKAVLNKQWSCWANKGETMNRSIKRWRHSFIRWPTNVGMATA